MNLTSTFLTIKLGGWVMAPLLIIAFMAIFIVIDKIIFYNFLTLLKNIFVYCVYVSIKYELLLILRSDELLLRFLTPGMRNIEEYILCIVYIY